MQPDPRSEYSQLLQDRRTAVVAGERRHRLLGYAQLGVAALAVAVVWISLARGFTVAWTAIPIAGFVALLVLHDRTLRDVERRRRAVRFFENALARLDGDWAGRGETGERYIDPAHPYAQDLDLFGKGSVFELLSTARTHIGEDTLARWLLVPADPALLGERNASVEELRPRIDLREDLAVLAEEARTGVDPAALAVWGEAPPILDRSSRGWIRALTVLGVTALAAFIGAGIDFTGIVNIPPAVAVAARYVFLLGLLVNGFFLHRRGKAIDQIVAAVDAAAHQLGLLSAILGRLERERFQSPLLARLRAQLDVEGHASSTRLGRLAHLAEKLDSRDNLFVRMLELFILWTPRHAAEVEEWRRHSGPAVRGWLETVGEIEALSSLASHAHQHPADTFAEFVPGGACLEAEGIGHPLLPESRVVRNSVRIRGDLRVLVVSGSNMSGKSTMLRTLGTNVVLAQAGAPVRAERLRLSPLAVGASIRLNDSLQGGVSRFYAEILRLRQILDLTAGPRPVLFLIDEFLNGTNSHDRRIGAQALVRGLVDRGAIGLVTTHDLALAEIADSLAERAANVHFEDTVENGQIHFDYVIRSGVVRKSNAIELMRSVGLEDLTSADIREMARECGFELAGVARAEPTEDWVRFADWVDAGHAGLMGYLTDRRAGVRDDPRKLLPSARSIVCVGKIYHTPYPLTEADPERAWISRYAWGADYHDELRRGLQRLDTLIRERSAEPFESRICVDTAPLLERSYARLAGLGWIGKNTMLIDQEVGSWFFLGELLVSLDIAPDAPPPDRCGTCTACIDECPTAAIGPLGVDSARCISYFTIELRGPVPEEHRPAIGNHVFGCDICQDVCPWNRRAPTTADTAFTPRIFAPPLDQLAALDEQAFRDQFRGTPVTRARYSGFLRNVAIAMGNAGLEKYRAPLETLAHSGDRLVAETARWALRRLSTDRSEP